MHIDMNKLLALFANEHERLFHYFYPGKNTGSSLKEASLIHDLLTAMRVSDDYQEVVSYEEFPVPNNSYYGVSSAGKWDEELDALAIVGKEIFGIEAKYLKTDIDSEKAKSIAWNMVRLVNVFSNPAVLPQLLWKDEAHLNHYSFDELRTVFSEYGLAVCNFWSKETNITNLRQLFVDRIAEGLKDVKQDCEQRGFHSFPNINLAIENCFMKEVKTFHPTLAKNGWHYYVSLYCWKIS